MKEHVDIQVYFVWRNLFFSTLHTPWLLVIRNVRTDLKYQAQTFLSQESYFECHFNYMCHKNAWIFFLMICHNLSCLHLYIFCLYKVCFPLILFPLTDFRSISPPRFLYNCHGQVFWLWFSLRAIKKNVHCENWKQYLRDEIEK